MDEKILNEDLQWGQLELNVVRWAGEKGILVRSAAPKQMIKVVEEVGELAREVLKSERQIAPRRELKDAIGDVLVTIIILAHQMGLDPEECLAMAYNEISGRTGRTVNGVFVKDEAQ